MANHDNQDPPSADLRPDDDQPPRLCGIREQIVEDAVTGLTLQFEQDPSGFTHLRIFGRAIPYGNRELTFGPSGALAATGTITQGVCRPTWLMRIADEDDSSDIAA